VEAAPIINPERLRNESLPKSCAAVEGGGGKKAKLSGIIESGTVKKGEQARLETR
jgi:hypothetical protein